MAQQEHAGRRTSSSTTNLAGGSPAILWVACRNNVTATAPASSLVLLHSCQTKLSSETARGTCSRQCVSSNTEGLGLEPQG